MRIIAGNLGGRTFQGPASRKTHPMSDKMRGALFSTLGDIEGLTVLDAFAGSGALSFEAVSRGARSALAIDSDRTAQRTISENIRSLRLGNSVKLVKANAASWLSTSDDSFDIVLCDPPYDDVKAPLLGRLAERAKLTGTVVLSLPPDMTVHLPAEYELITSKDYGDSSLRFYKRTT
jgi:16S rRNA (guanine966-N2)-methyltransferase